MNLKDEILLTHAKPGRYIGNEINMAEKSIAGKIRFAFCFPDVYEIGMSHLGLQILYFLLNRRDDVFCERVFMPCPDMMETLKREALPLFALETGDPVGDFDFVGFTLQSETSYTNVLAMLDLAGLPLLAAERGKSEGGPFPIICAGGPCAVNPEPLADFIDFFYIGDGEAALEMVLDKYPRGQSRTPLSKEAFLLEIAALPGVYVPRFYDAQYNGGRLVKFAPNRSGVPAKVAAAKVTDLDAAFFPEKTLVPLIETVHNRTVIELFRGCARGCRFCQAGMIGRPLRERAPATLLRQAESLLGSTGHEEISMVSLSTGDYSAFAPLLDGLMAVTECRNVNISLPSLRMDSVSLSAMEKTQKVRKSSLTLAPEAGTQRLRDVINKNLNDTEIAEGLAAAFGAGYDRIKLYFMAGLPTEDESDLLGIAELCGTVVDEYYRLPRECRRRPVSVQVSCSCFVPKPFTPFQWERQISAEEFLRGQRLVKGSITKKQITYRYHDANTALVEGALARGGRPMGAVILAAYRHGAILDSWTEHFNFGAWEKALGGLNENEFLRPREDSELLPWDFIDVGVSKEFLLRERERAYSRQLSPDCLTGCAGCGICRDTVRRVRETSPTPEPRGKSQPVTDCNRLDSPDTARRVPTPQRYLLRFSKLRKMKFVGHLDMLKIFQAAIRRAGLDIAYSTGFNPHQKITFALPLPLGAESICEYAEIVLNATAEPERSAAQSERLAAALNRELPSGLEVLAVLPLTESAPKSASVLRRADYFLPGAELEAAAIEAILNRPEIIVTKRTKSGERETDIRPDIFLIQRQIKSSEVVHNTRCAFKQHTPSTDLFAGLAGEGILIRLSAGSARNLQPALAVQTILGKTEQPIIRAAMLDENNRPLHEAVL